MTTKKFFIQFTNITLSNKNWIDEFAYYNNYFMTNFVKYKAQLLNGSYIPDLSNSEVFNNIEVNVFQSKGYFKQKHNPGSFFSGVLKLDGVDIDFKDPDSGDVGFTCLVYGSVERFDCE